MPKLPKVYVDVEPWHFRPQTTDWRYVRHMLPRLVEFQPELLLHMQECLGVAVRANAKHVAAALRRRMFGASRSRAQSYADHLDAGELRRSGCGVVFSHRGFPVNAGEVPVVWQNSILDPEMRISYTGCSEADLQPEVEAKGALFRRAAVVQVSTMAECRRLGALFPGIADRFRQVGFFLPDVTACPPEVLDKHNSPDVVRVLFVGREARRKGLDLLLHARQRLPLLLRQRMRLKIVSTFADGRIAVPDDDSVEVVGRLDHPGLLREMQRAHILVHPARFESFGLVLVEAMSQGAVAVGPNWEVQRELLDCGPDGGNAGVVVSGDAAALSDKLAWLIEDDEGRRAMATRARQRFLDHYAPTIVARQFVGVFRAAAGQGQSNRQEA